MASRDSASGKEAFGGAALPENADLNVDAWIGDGKKSNGAQRIPLRKRLRDRNWLSSFSFAILKCPRGDLRRSHASTRSEAEQKTSRKQDIGGKMYKGGIPDYSEGAGPDESPKISSAGI